MPARSAVRDGETVTILAESCAYCPFQVSAMTEHARDEALWAHHAAIHLPRARIHGTLRATEGDPSKF